MTTASLGFASLTGAGESRPSTPLVDVEVTLTHLRNLARDLVEAPAAGRAATANRLSTKAPTLSPRAIPSVRNEVIPSKGLRERPEVNTRRQRFTAWIISLP